MLNITVNIELERYGIYCTECDSITWYDYDEEPAQCQQCWRCGEIINDEL